MIKDLIKHMKWPLNHLNTFGLPPHAAPALPAERTGAGRGPALFAPDTRAVRRVLEFFTAHIRNPHTRKAYARAAAGLAAWCDAQGIGHLRDVKPVHVAAYVEDLQLRIAAPDQRRLTLPH